MSEQDVRFRTFNELLAEMGHETCHSTDPNEIRGHICCTLSPEEAAMLVKRLKGVVRRGLGNDARYHNGAAAGLWVADGV